MFYYEHLIMATQTTPEQILAWQMVIMKNYEEANGWTPCRKHVLMSEKV